MVKTNLSTLGLLALLSACIGTEPAPEATAPAGKSVTSIADGGTIIQTGAWTIPPSVRGTPPQNALGVPSFSGVMNQDEVLVSSQDLIGHFSVLWFYPFANTSG
jgi:hypothetical protein